MKKLFVCGHRGMVGAAVVRAAEASGKYTLLLRSRQELDLQTPDAVNAVFEQEKPDAVIHCAARVGGIVANSTFPADFMAENINVSFSVIDAARRHRTPRLLYLGSSCIYPRHAPQPIPETALLGSPLETTNEAYAIAKIAALKYCQYIRQQEGLLFHSAMPTNLYGPKDHYHPTYSHVIPGLLRKFHHAINTGSDSVTVWGTGNVKREFLHVDDLARALLILVESDNPPDIVNIGTGTDITIRELAETIARVTGFKGSINFDTSMPDGTPRKCLDVSRITSLGWRPTTDLETGLRQTYEEAAAAGLLEE
jgi:GDP-L-fucose synthase